MVTENLNPNKYPKDFTETKVECQGRQYKGLKFSKADIQLIRLLNQKTGAADIISITMQTRVYIRLSGLKMGMIISLQCHRA